MRMKSKNRRDPMMRKQRLMGIALILLSIAVFWLSLSGVTPEDRDATAGVLILPLGIYLLMSKHVVVW